MVVNALFILVGFFLGLLFALVTRLWIPPVAGELVIDTVNWDVDKYNISFTRLPLDELPDHKYVTLIVRQAITDRERNIGFNDTN